MNIHNRIKDVGMSVMIMGCQYLILNLQNALIILLKSYTQAHIRGGNRIIKGPGRLWGLA